MKCLIFVMCLPLFSAAQVYKFRAFESTVVHLDHSGDFIAADPWLDCRILVVLDLTKLHLAIYSQDQQDFDMTKEIMHYSENSGSSLSKFQAVDQAGKEMTLKYIFFAGAPPDHVASVYLEYADHILVYRLRKD